jgi:hypothetical protein
MQELVSIDGGIDELIDYYEEKGWTDGLPVLPPTEARVGRMLAYTDLSPDDSVGAIPATEGDATVHAVAVNAVMAGCRPEYLPVVLAAVKGLTDPDFNTYGMQATTNPVCPIIVVNGPIARELNINSEGNVLGAGFRANATIGRAVRLCLLNIGGGQPHTMDKSTHGQPAKAGLCIAENERDSPWEPFHVERGHDPSTSAVSLMTITGTQHILKAASKTGLSILRTLCSATAHVGMQNVLLGGGPLIIFSPEHAQIIADDGFTKNDVREFLYEHARVPVSAFPPEVLEGYIHLRRARRYWSQDPSSAIPMADSPGRIQLVVAGGIGPHTVIAPSFGEATSTPVVPITFKDGTPVGSVEQLRSA